MEYTITFTWDNEANVWGLPQAMTFLVLYWNPAHLMLYWSVHALPYQRFLS